MCTNPDMVSRTACDHARFAYLDYGRGVTAIMCPLQLVACLSLSRSPLCVRDLSELVHSPRCSPLVCHLSTMKSPTSTHAERAARQVSPARAAQPPASRLRQCTHSNGPLLQASEYKLRQLQVRSSSLYRLRALRAPRFILTHAFGRLLAVLRGRTASCRARSHRASISISPRTRTTTATRHASRSPTTQTGHCGERVLLSL